METEKKVNWTANALFMVTDIYEYLAEEASEQIASDYIDDMIAFGSSLNLHSTVYAYCRHPELAAKGYRCALFRKTYLLIYKSDETRVDILAIIHAKRGPEAYEEV